MSFSIKILLNRISMVLLVLSVFVSHLFAEDTTTIKVHFLYGSKPKKEFKNKEKTWFGGMLGGHVGIEYKPGHVIDFVPSGRFHLLSHQKHRHSRFNVRSVNSFWTAFGCNSIDAKKASFIIQINTAQKQKLDSIVGVYSQSTPYDYAFLGMRCGSAAYDILSQIGIMKKCKKRNMVLKIFYPKKLRHRLFKLAQKENWKVETQEGTHRRIWEQD